LGVLESGGRGDARGLKGFVFWVVGVLVLGWEGEGKGGVEDSGEDSVDWYRMPEYPKALSQEICENISDLFPQCLDTGSLLFCNNSHGGAGAASVESGGISVPGKKRHSQLEFVDGKRCRNMALGHAKDDRKMTTPQPSLEVLGASTGLKASPVASTLKPLIDTPSNHRCCNVIPLFRVKSFLPMCSLKLKVSFFTLFICTSYSYNIVGTHLCFIYACGWMVQRTAKF
jgi:hypothetical protein